MAYEFLLIDVRDGVATVTLNRPDKLNALNVATIAELDRCITEIESRSDVGAMVLTGAGRAFAAGADIGEIASLTPSEALTFAERGQRVFRRVETLRKPTIAAVNGFALGGGCELAMACHLRVASETASFGQPEVKLGLIPGYGGTQRLARLVGRGRALELLLTGEPITAADAYRMGLVNHVYAPELLLPMAGKLARKIIAQAPLAIAACLASVDAGLAHDLESGLAVEARAFGVLAGTADAREGTAAFAAKRAPNFAGE